MSIHKSTGYSPYKLVFGKIPHTPIAYPPIEEGTDVTYRQYLTNLFNKIQDTRENVKEHPIRSKETILRSTYVISNLEIMYFSETNLKRENFLISISDRIKY